MEIGKVVKEFLSTEENRRNSEGAFIRMPSGRIVYAYSAYVGNSWHDDAHSNMAIVYSDDEGKTFSEPQTVLTAEDCNADNIMSFSLLPMLDGSVGVFYCKKTETNTDYCKCTPCLRRTFDFKTFSEEIECTTERAYFTLNNDRVVRLKNGNLILPLAVYDKEGIDKGYIGKAVFYISKDDGYTFEASQILSLPSKRSKTGLQEPGIIELENGSIYAFFRTDLGCQYESVSNDGGYTWTAVEPSLFTSPTSPMSIKTLSDGKNLAVFNPEPWYYGKKEGRSGGRAPLIALLLDGNLNALSPFKYVEESKDRGYCYTSIFEGEDYILLGYCSGYHEWPKKSVLEDMTIKRVLKSEL